MKKIVALLLSAAMLLSGCTGVKKAADGSESAASKGISTKYVSKLFDTGYVHKINIKISDTDWSDLLKNPTKKTKYKVNVTIDGETVDDVSFSTKGNTSLSSIASSDSTNKYSFKINFGKYVDNQTYYGLNKLNLNNIYADATYMKDYISYQIAQKAGVDTPLTSYIQVTVNGKAQGLYLAIEDVSESFLARTENGKGELYKPETEQLNNVGDTKGKMDGTNDKSDTDSSKTTTDNSNGTKPGGMTPPDQNGSSNQNGSSDQTPPDQNGSSNQNGSSDQTPSDQNGSSNQMTPPNGGFKGGNFDKSGDKAGGKIGFGSSNDKGASLKYTDDKIASYSDIFDNAETDATEKNKKTVIASLKGLSQYLSNSSSSSGSSSSNSKKSSSTDLEKYVDTSSVINYFVAHNFVMNYDSYTGNMLHNYYLYENNGKLSMIPWDYNLAFGAFSGGGMGGGRPGNGQKDQSDSTTQNADNTSTAVTQDNADKSNTEGTQNNADNTNNEMNQSSNATEIVNYGIDTPLSGVEESDRPMWSWITSNEKYLKEYHEAYNKLLKSYFESGDFEKEVNRVAKMIRPYVEKDNYAEYTASQFDTAVSTLKTFCEKRAESIRKQLDGTLSTDTDKQTDSTRVDASDINIQSMGSQGRGNNKAGNK
jgi:spore coat protein CotH